MTETQAPRPYTLADVAILNHDFPYPPGTNAQIRTRHISIHQPGLQPRYYLITEATEYKGPDDKVGVDITYATVTDQHGQTKDNLQEGTWLGLVQVSMDGRNYAAVLQRLLDILNEDIPTPAEAPSHQEFAPLPDEPPLKEWDGEDMSVLPARPADENDKTPTAEGRPSDRLHNELDQPAEKPVDEHATDHII